MNRRKFLLGSMAAAVSPSDAATRPIVLASESVPHSGAVLVIDTDRATAAIDTNIYGQFLEHINHSVEDGLFAEQVRGAGFEGEDFKTYWQPFSEHGSVEIAHLAFQNGSQSVRLKPQGGEAGIRQPRIYLDAGQIYDGFVWAKREQGSPRFFLRIKTSQGRLITTIPLALTGHDWQKLPFSFTSPVHDPQAAIELAAQGHGALLLDFLSMMRADVRRDGALRPDLLEALRQLRPAFIRWPGGSFASTYKWKDGIGPYESRGYHPNTFWGGYSDYYGFGTEEVLGLCRKLDTEPLIVLPAQGTHPEQIAYAMDWVHYLNDPPTTEWGRRRAANGHPEPHNVKLFQIDNEPMNNGFTPEQYAAIVNEYGRQLRTLAPHARIVACGQKRSVDMDWSETVIDLAGENFDILGCHNYEYEPNNFETGLQRIRDYLTQLSAYVRASKYPRIEIAVLEWSLQHTYDWRAGLHAAGSLMLFEELSPSLGMACPALLMRNTTDDPKWTSSIYHDHVSWFPGASFPVQKLFREHYAEKYLASATGSFADPPPLPFEKISTRIPAGWTPGSVDAIATASPDGRRIVIKAVNYRPEKNELLVQLKGAGAPAKATATLYTITARLNDQASLEHPDAIAPVTRLLEYTKDISLELAPYTVAVVEIQSA